MTAVAYAPAGWGWRPGALLSADDNAIVAQMPVLALLKQAGTDGATRNKIVHDALADMPHLIPHLWPRHLVRKYSIPHVSASAVLSRLKAGSA